MRRTAATTSTITITAAIAIALSLGACEDKDAPPEQGAGESEPAAPEAGADEPTVDGAGAEKPAAAAVELVEIDLTEALSEAGREAETTVVIDAPEGATVEEAFGSVVVTAGETFALSIGTDAADLDEARTFMKDNDVQKFQRFVVDEPDVVAAEAEAFRRKSVFMTANVEVGEETLSCESERGGKSFDEAAVRAMIKACKTMRLK